MSSCSWRVTRSGGGSKSKPALKTVWLARFHCAAGEPCCASIAVTRSRSWWGAVDQCGRGMLLSPGGDVADVWPPRLKWTHGHLPFEFGECSGHQNRHAIIVRAPAAGIAD